MRGKARAADLRHLPPPQKAVDGEEAVPGSGGQARPLQDAAGPLLLPRAQPRLVLLQAQGRPNLQ